MALTKTKFGGGTEIPAQANVTFETSLIAGGNYIITIKTYYYETLAQTNTYDLNKDTRTEKVLMYMEDKLPSLTGTLLLTNELNMPAYITFSGELILRNVAGVIFDPCVVAIMN